jgi:spoIIIJ-associated protein
MSSRKQDFYAKEITEAITMACDALGAAQEDLDIDVVETGSNGIFGLIRKKAHIRAAVRSEEQVAVASPEPEEQVEKVVSEVETGALAEDSVKEVAKPAKKKSSPPPKPAEPVTEESAELVRHELSEILSLMGFASDVTAEVDGATVRCQVSDEHEEPLTSQEGKIIDSLQYLLRKFVARKVEEKIRLSIDIGQFREKRKVELMERAKELAALVKEDGKTQAIPPLNPSERRIVHVALQDDKDIRSRSVGGGLFKKILIYKPGKGKKPNANKRGGRGKGKKGDGKKVQGKASSDD